MRPSSLIDQTHPSFGCAQAWFTVAVCRPGSDGPMTRLLLVEARNAWAVATIERIAAGGGRVSPTSFVVAVHRNCEDVAMRSDLVDEVDYVDFMIDIVDPGLLLEDALTATGFRNSLTDEERVRASEKLQSVPVRRPTLRAVTPPPEAPAAAEPEQVDRLGPAVERLTSGLVGLGFKAASVRKVVDAMGSRPAAEPIEVLMKEAIRKLSAAA